MANLAANKKWTVKQLRNNLQNKKTSYAKTPPVASHVTPKSQASLLISPPADTSVQNCNLQRLFDQVLVEQKSKRGSQQCSLCPDKVLCDRIVDSQTEQQSKMKQPEAPKTPEDKVYLSTKLVMKKSETNKSF